MKSALFSWVIIVSVSSAIGCGSRRPGGDGDVGGGGGGGRESVISRYLGDGVTIGDYDDSGFAGEASDLNQLHCDFNGPCCWRNAQPPEDELEFRKASGNVDPNRFQDSFGTSQLPSGDFLVVASDEAAGPIDKAILYSCSTCGQNMAVSVVHYASPGVRLQACVSSKTAPIECQDLTGASGVPDVVNLRGGQPDSHLLVVASNLVDPAGSIAIIDSIDVSGTPCGGGAGCEELACAFNNDLCHYRPLGSGDSQWGIQGPGIFRNPATGVRPSLDGTRYAAVYLKPGQTADMAAETSLFQGGEYFLRFQEYKATEGLRFSGCCNDIKHCSYDTGAGVEKADFGQWFQGGFSCPQGTRKVIFHAENRGVNEGAVGIDNINIYEKGSDTALC